MSRRTWEVLLFAAVATACGGRVNLGNDESMSAAGAAAGGAPAIDLQPRILRNLPAEEPSFNDFTVADGKFYVGGYMSLWQVRINQARDSWRRIDTLSRSPFALTPFGGKLGMTLANSPSDSVMLATCALPACSSIEPVFSFETYRSPPSAGGFFVDDAVFWGISSDRSIYRCALPDCAGGPRAIWTSSWDSMALRTLGDTLFLLDGHRLYRSRQVGASPTEGLVPDTTLNAVAPSALTDYKWLADGIATDGTSLYAIVEDYSGPSCTGSCSRSVVRWGDLGNGSREVILSDATSVIAIAAYDGELVWVEDGTGELKTCRAENCADTQRSVGHTRNYSNGSRLMAVADDRNLYWLDAIANTQGGTLQQFVSISAVSLLPKPQ